jgi:hypothetical protein
MLFEIFVKRKDVYFTAAFVSGRSVIRVSGNLRLQNHGHNKAQVHKTRAFGS